MSLWILLLAVCLTDAPGSAPAGEEQALRLPVTRDTWFSNVGQEADCNLGGASKLKVKSIQEMALIDFDPEPLRGRVIRRATLHVRLTSPERLHRMSISSFAAPWVEGTAESYAPQAGSSTHRHREHPGVPWTFPGSDLCDVILGRSGTLWHSADSMPPDKNGWQQIPVDPRVLAARAAGVSYGCLVFDDTGSEWTREGEKFSLRLFPNRFFASREAGAQRAPYFTVEMGDKDDLPPEPPADLASDAADLPAGEAYLTWLTPADHGPAGVIGFFVEIDGREVPRYLIPAASAACKRVSMHLRDFPLAPGAEVVASVSAVDAAGNRSAAVKKTVRVSDRRPQSLPEFSLPEKAAVGPLPRLGPAEIAVIDALDKVQPVTGELIPQEPNGYLASNHLWNAKARKIELSAAKNEFVDFQLLVRGSEERLHVEASFSTLPANAAVGRLRYVMTRRGPLPDPVMSVDSPTHGVDGDSLAAAATRGYLVELYVPHDAKAGKHAGMLKLRLGSDELELPLSLTVWDFTLPDFLSFLPEMNCYGLPPNERDYYRLAHAHRTVLNRVPYHQNGSIAEGCAPEWDGRLLDWTAWDRRFGAYLDGSAFADLPRASVPLECFYLPLHENWPSPMEGAYNGSYWADQAFPESYREAFVSASKQMATHFGERGWRDTIFQCFLNGKNNFKANGWSRGSSPWLLDEPANFQDYWALRYFGLAFHEGESQAAAGAKMFYRCDISRPEWQRDVLDDVLDYNVVGGAFRHYRRMALDRKQATGQTVVEYGSTNAIEDSNVQPAGWCIDAWTLGADGVLPWQTIGRAESWQHADALALFYPSENPEIAPAPSLRLKAYRRGQQDVEYLTLWMLLTRQPRWAVGQTVREALALVGERRGTGIQGGEDAGVIQYAKLLPADLWKLRMRIGQELSRRRPPATRRLVQFAAKSHRAD